MSVVLALPSKGRLKEQCADWLAANGLRLIVDGGERGYTGRLDGAPDVEVRLMSAGDIGRALLAGDVEAGVTGEDVVREAAADADDRLVFRAALGFGRADVVVAVPNGWLDVDRMSDLSEVAADVRRRTGRRFRVATKFTRLTSDWFARHQVLDHRIVDSAGATEGAPGAGVAEAIVDITTTGATLAANGLKILEDGLILRSQSWLIESRRAPAAPKTRAALDAFVARLREGGVDRV